MAVLELLAPARNSATAIAAINHGADAVYIGAPAFGARAAAANSLEDISEVVSYAHRFGVKVYVTLNTIIYEDELEAVRNLAGQLWRIGVDALIVQDMGILELDIPPIDLHASTQTDARPIEKIRRLARSGFSQVVLPREFSLLEISEASKAIPDTRIEVFVHGALCVSYSGDCQAGAVLTGRSANRGECPQICRLEFTLTNKDGHPVTPPDGGSPTRHWLSLADLNRLDYLADLIEAGASSFKIEGRLKSADYVKNVTAAYSKALDKIIEMSDGKHRRQSFGSVETSFTPDVSQAFNRGFTPYFLKSANHDTGITSWNTPKWIGRPVGEVVGVKGNSLKIRIREQINNGDGLGFFNSDGRFTGFRVNRAEGNLIFPAPGADVPTVHGTKLYRNADVGWDAKMARADSAVRTISVDMTLRRLPDGRIALDASDERGCSISVTSAERFNDVARSPQGEQRHSLIERLGDTIYRLKSLNDLCGDIFIPAKALAALRRQAVDALDSNRRMRFRRTLRRPSTLDPDSMKGLVSDYHDNISNPLAEHFYRSHGAETGARAVEIEKPKGAIRIMTTRYCLRRELGCCLKTPQGDKLPRELFLDAPIGRLRLSFDCPSCTMQVHTT